MFKIVEAFVGENAREPLARLEVKSTNPAFELDYPILVEVSRKAMVQSGDLTPDQAAAAMFKVSDG